jgi:hypothetical protein
MLVPVKGTGSIGVNKDLSEHELVRAGRGLKKVELSFGREISRVGGFFRFKQAKANCFFPDRYVRSPLVSELVPTHADVSRFVVRLHSAVLLVFVVNALAKVAKSVIGLVTVDVVDLARGPLAVHVKPSQSVRQESPSEHLYSVRSCRKGYLNSSLADKRLDPVPFPAENAGFRVVVEGFPQFREVNVVHFQFPLVGLRGLVLGNWHGDQLSGATLAKQVTF